MKMVRKSSYHFDYTLTNLFRWTLANGLMRLVLRFSCAVQF